MTFRIYKDRVKMKMLKDGRAEFIYLYVGSTAFIYHQINEDGNEFYVLRLNDEYHTICHVEYTYKELIEALPRYKDYFSMDDYNKMNGNIQLSINF